MPPPAIARKVKFHMPALVSTVNDAHGILRRSGLPNYTTQFGRFCILAYYPFVIAIRFTAIQNRLHGGFDGVGRDAAAAVDLAVVFDFEGHFALGVFADGDAVDLESLHVSLMPVIFSMARNTASIGPSPSVTSSVNSLSPRRSVSLTRGLWPVPLATSNATSFHSASAGAS